MLARLRSLLIVAIALPTAAPASSVYDDLKRALEPGKGDLIVNVNAATPKELETIPCIGEKLAREIIRGRPYDNVDDLKRVKGIGDYTFNCMRPYVKVEGKTGRR